MTSQPLVTQSDALLEMLYQQIVIADQTLATVPPEARSVVREAFQALYIQCHALTQLNDDYAARLHRAHALIEAERAAAETLLQQRDAIGDEYASLLRSIEQGNINILAAPPDLREVLYKLYAQIKEMHNEAFWQSLPYDIASIMSQFGLEVEHTEAELLYELLTTDFEEVAPEDFGWTHAQVTSARLRLIEIARQMLHLSYEDGEGADDDLD
jgi:hypothetical protein